MVSDRIEFCLAQIKKATENWKINWRPIIEYLNDYNDNKQISARIQNLTSKKNTKFYYEQSFYAKKDDSYIFILSYQNVSAIDKKISEDCEMIVVHHQNANIYKVPPYIRGGIEAIRDLVVTYWEDKTTSYPCDTFDMIDTLDKFACDTVISLNDLG